jgi:alkanesulfonate monooxygenase SsuD/methylene tetrahydromethanopterin reductase-like flavin-dependent oxidoreductase (luciferase family)
MSLPAIRPGRRWGLGFKTSPQDVEWPALEATWRLAAELDLFDSAWMNDHLTHPGRPRGGHSYDSLTAMAALAHLVPGLWLGHGVLAITFRHPAVVAKAATVIDHVTGGRFILGLGAGWHPGEHEAFGLPLPPIGERMDRLTSAIGVFRALFSPEAGGDPGVTRDDPFYPLERAVNEPAPVRPGGPPIWLGGKKPRGLRMAGTLADGWYPAADDRGIDVFVERRTVLLRHLEESGRDPAGFSFVSQVAGGRSADEDRESLGTAKAYLDAGATHVIVSIDAGKGPAALQAATDRIARPLLEAMG